MAPCPVTAAALSGRAWLASGGVARAVFSVPLLTTSVSRDRRRIAPAVAVVQSGHSVPGFAARTFPGLNVATRLVGASRSSCRSAVVAMAGVAKKVLVPIADGCEEMEAVITIDVLVRAGAEVTVASVDNQTVTCSRGVKLQADTLIADATGTTFDLIAVPGGMPGAEHFRDCDPLVKMIQEQKAAGRLYAAICASPAVVFEHHGLLDGQPATSHPAFQENLTNKRSVSERVVESGTLTTSQGPGTAFEFALSLVKQLYGEEKMREIAGPMCMYPTPLLSS